MHDLASIQIWEPTEEAAGRCSPGAALSGSEKMCQTAAPQMRPHCLSKIKQCLASLPSAPLLLLLLLPALKYMYACTRTYIYTYTHTHTHTPPPARTLIVSQPREFNNEQIAVIGEHTTEVGGWSSQRQCGAETERASANWTNISVSLRAGAAGCVEGDCVSTQGELNLTLAFDRAAGRLEDFCDPEKPVIRSAASGFYL